MLIKGRKRLLNLLRATSPTRHARQWKVGMIELKKLTIFELFKVSKKGIILFGQKKNHLKKLSSLEWKAQVPLIAMFGISPLVAYFSKIWLFVAGDGKVAICEKIPATFQNFWPGNTATQNRTMLLDKMLLSLEKLQGSKVFATTPHFSLQKLKKGVEFRLFGLWLCH